MHPREAYLHGQILSPYHIQNFPGTLPKLEESSCVSVCKNTQQAYLPLLRARCGGGSGCWRGNRRKSSATPRKLGGACPRSLAALEAATSRTRGRGADLDGLEAASGRVLPRPLRHWSLQDFLFALVVGVAGSAAGDQFAPDSCAPDGDLVLIQKTAMALPGDGSFFRPRCGGCWSRSSWWRFEQRLRLVAERKGRRKLDPWVYVGYVVVPRIACGASTRGVRRGSRCMCVGWFGLCTAGCVHVSCRRTNNTATTCERQLTGEKSRRHITAEGCEQCVPISSP